MPETAAQTMASMRSASQDVVCDKDSDAAGRHEQTGRNDGSGGEACNATDAMTAGATAAESRAEADQHAADQDLRPRIIPKNDRRAGKYLVKPGRANQTEQEGDAPDDVALASSEQVAEDATDAGDSAFTSHSSAAAQPIRMPPRNEAMGVKLAIERIYKLSTVRSR
jgi:hypothetical protein